MRGGEGIGRRSAVRPDALREALFKRALAEIPKLLTLLDRTSVSPTYGCFDRSYWHYRITDFPCGMSQEFVLPLALAWSIDRPDNPYFRSPTVRSWVEAGIRYAARSSHADGSCDDYYPFERATGAAAFSLYAFLEAMIIVGLEADAEIDHFLVRRGLWLGRHRERGELSNHEALIVASLDRLGERYGRNRFEGLMRQRLDRLLSWQSGEGWFSEYGGADLGYLSLTIGLLADLDQRRPDLKLREPLAAAIRFFALFVHPDGTVGGEYSSRATLNFFPHGFEIAGAWMPEALAVNDQALVPLAQDRMPCYSDDRIVGHHLWSWLLAYRAFRSERPAHQVPAEGRQWFPEAQLVIDRREGVVFIAALGRGGVFKLFRDDALLVSDTGPTLQVGDKGRVAVTHLEGRAMIRFEGDEIIVDGRFAWAKTARLTPVKNVALRLLMLSFGRFCPNLVRGLLQRILVTGRTEAPFRYRRVFRPIEGGWSVSDEIMADHGWSKVRSAGIGGFQSSTATVMARVFRLEQLQPPLDLGNRLAGLDAKEPLTVKRKFGAGCC
jgi:hypothetical protein